MKNIFLIFISVLMSFLFSCKQHPKETLYIPEEMKPFIMFPEGSWWVYEDSLTGHIDSFYLAKQNIEFFDEPLTYFEKELLKQEYKHFKENIFEGVLQAQTFYHNKICIFDNSLKARFSNLSVEDSIDIMVGYLKKRAVISEVSFNNLTFENVELITEYVFYNDTANYFKKKSFWCKDIGMIKLVDYKYYSEEANSYKDTLIIRKLKNFQINN